VGRDRPKNEKCHVKLKLIKLKLKGVRLKEIKKKEIPPRRNPHYGLIGKKEKDFFVWHYFFSIFLEIFRGF